MVRCRWRATHLLDPDKGARRIRLHLSARRGSQEGAQQGRRHRTRGHSQLRHNPRRRRGITESRTPEIRGVIRPILLRREPGGAGRPASSQSIRLHGRTAPRRRKTDRPRQLLRYKTSLLHRRQERGPGGQVSLTCPQLTLNQYSPNYQ